ncbi:MAG: PP2C family protein-serine/threonine phosphatase [Candidatus Shapirobacteria bacterium]|nr:PP2C family protein-serine/threonine phosphatase [Candidatus Shapirobacteria bacterium]
MIDQALETPRQINRQPEAEKRGDFNFGWESHPSPRHPNNNEDSFLCLPEKGVFAVFDGVSSVEYGQDAATVARISLENFFLNAKMAASSVEAESQARKALVLASKDISQTGIETKTGGQTTGVVACFWENPQNPKERALVVASVGDSRVYIVKNGQIEQVTLDDGPVKTSAISEDQARKTQSRFNNCLNPDRELNPSERHLFRQRNKIYQALGQDHPVVPTTHVLPLDGQETIIICSDGVSDNLTDQEIKAIVQANPNNQEAARNLADTAKRRSQTNHPRAKMDDITAIVIKNKTKSGSWPNETEEAAPIAIGSPVRIQRSNGRIESDWTIESIDIKTGSAFVTKPGPEEGLFLRKRVTLKLIDRLNRPALPADIDTAENLDQLFDTINQLGQIEGSRQTFTSEDLFYLIREVADGRKRPDVLPRTHNLRKTVIELVRRD